jgi:hypothetical protein
MLKACPEGPPSQKTPPHPPKTKKKFRRKTQRVAGWKNGKLTAIKTKRIAKRKNGKYIHNQDKWIALRAKMREANLREEGLIRKTAGFLRKVLPNYTAERQPKNVVQGSDTPLEIPVALTPKHESGDVEFIDVIESGKNHISLISCLVFEKKAIHL